MTSRTPFSRTAPRRAPRAIATGLLGLAATFSLTACQWTSPITTQLQYDAADGKSTEVGKVKVLNALIVADKQDGPGTLVASFANQGSDKATIQVRVGQQVAGSVEVPAGAVVQASTGEKRLQVAKVPAAPGATTEVIFQAPDGSVSPIAVPVLPATGPYDTLKPSAVASTSAPASPSGSATATPAAPGATNAPATTTP